MLRLWWMVFACNMLFGQKKRVLIAFICLFCERRRLLWTECVISANDLNLEPVVCGEGLQEKERKKDENTQVLFHQWTAERKAPARPPSELYIRDTQRKWRLRAPVTARFPTLPDLQYRGCYLVRQLHLDKLQSVTYLNQIIVNAKIH